MQLYLALLLSLKENMNISKPFFRRLFPVIMVFQFCITFLLNDFGLPLFLLLIFMFLYLILEIVELLVYNNSIHLNSKLLPTAGITLIIALETIRKLDFSDTTRIYIFLSLIISFMCLVFSEFSEYFSILSEKIVVWTGILFALLMILFHFVPQIYTNFFFNYLSEETIVYFKNLIAHGYGAPIGGSISYSLFLLIFAVFILIFGRYKLFKHYYINLFFSIAIIIAVLFSQRRTEIVFLFIAIIVGLIVKRDLIRRAYKKHPFLLILCALIIIIGVIVVLFLFIYLPSDFKSENRMLMTIVDLKNNEDASNGRLVLYEIAWKTFKQFPIFGIGWMNFGDFAIQSGNTLARNVHNIYLQLYTEMGFIVGTFFVGLLIINLLIARKNIKLNRVDMTGYMILLYIILAGFLDNTIYYTFIWPIYMISIYISVFRPEGKLPNINLSREG